MQFACQMEQAGSAWKFGMQVPVHPSQPALLSGSALPSQWPVAASHLATNSYPNTLNQQIASDMEWYDLRGYQQAKPDFVVAPSLQPQTPLDTLMKVSSVLLSSESSDDEKCGESTEPWRVSAPYCGQKAPKKRLPKGQPVKKQVPEWVF